MKEALRAAQMEENIRALLAFYGLPMPKPIKPAEVDRVWLVRDADFLEAFYEIAPQKDEKFNPRKHRFERWTHLIEDHGDGTGEDGWHERVLFNSLQFILYPWCFEMDIDRSNPQHGLLGLFGHIGEVLRKGKTNSFKVADGLRDRGVEVKDVRKS